MASIQSLPNEIFVRIFSYFDYCELLRLERVCQRWTSVIQEFVWNCLTCVNEEAIGYPDEDYVNNFIEIAHRVREVSEFYSVLSLLFGKSRSNTRLKHAIAELLSKHTADAIFPLDLVSEALSYESCDEPKKPKQLPLISETRETVGRVVDELRVLEFSAIRIEEVSMHNSESGSDAFTVSYKGRGIPIPIDTNRITKLYIGSLNIWMMHVNKAAVLTARNLMNRIMSFARLDYIEVESMQLVEASSCEIDQSSVAEITLHFHPHACKFNIDEFVAFLTTLSKDSYLNRDDRLAQLIDQWKHSNALKNAEVSIHNLKFDSLKKIINTGKSVDKNAAYVEATDLVLGAVYPILTDKLHLRVCYDTDGEEKLISLLRKKNLFNLLKEFSFSFTDDQGQDVEEVISWCPSSGPLRAKKIYLVLSKDLHNLERLSLNFSLAGRICPSSMFRPVALVSEPLPRLQEFSCYGLPCFPYLISVTKHAPNLRQLYVTSGMFEDEQAGIEWIKKLLDSLRGSKSLRTLAIHVNGNDELDRYVYGLRRPADDPQRDRSACREILDEIERLINNLVSTLPLLYRVIVDLKGSGYCYDLDKYSLKDEVVVQ